MSVVIASGFEGIVEPIDNPRIGFDAPVSEGTASSSADGYDPNWAADGETWSVWEAGGNTSSLTISFPSQTISYAGIAAHNLASIGGSVSCSAGGSISPTDNDAVMFLFAPQTASSVTFTFSGGGPARVAVARAGAVLEMPRPSVYLGTPISQSRQVTYRHQRSIRGDILGRAVEGAQKNFEFTTNNLPETFRESTDVASWNGFLRHIDNVGPFFIAAKPLSYPDDVAYVQAAERPRFTRETPNRALSGSITISCTGYSAP